MSRKLVVSCAGLVVLCASTLHAQTLGRVNFPTSGAPAAQAAFLSGVGYLHNFEYASAARAFREAQRLDPGFAMAYWGEAMTHTHPIWNQKEPDSARAVLARLGPTPAARAARAKTERERGYLRAVEVLYGEGPKPKLDTLYALEMEKLSAAFPDDDEARSFYALALLGLSQGVRVVPTYMKAGAIALDVMSRNPEHPGAVHYAIHAFDDPTHAPLGLHAARTYSRIAPDAPHAQHMTTHIFLALGMWDEVIAQNTIASGPAREAWRPGHYTSWLGYGLLQAGRHDEARRHLEVMWRNLRPASVPAGYMMLMRAAYLIDTERWDDAIGAWEIPATTWTGAAAADAFARAYAALRGGAAGTHEESREQLARLAEGSTDEVAAVLTFLLEGAEAHAAGETERAIELLREAATREEKLPVEFGPPVIVKPSHELLGEVLLASGRAEEAVTAFRKSLELAPKRWLSLRGLARAAERAGDRETAERAQAEWTAIWHDADAQMK